MNPIRRYWALLHEDDEGTEIRSHRFMMGAWLAGALVLTLYMLHLLPWADVLLERLTLVWHRQGPREFAYAAGIVSAILASMCTVVLAHAYANQSKKLTAAVVVPATIIAFTTALLAAILFALAYAVEGGKADPDVLRPISWDLQCLGLIEILTTVALLGFILGPLLGWDWKLDAKVGTYVTGAPTPFWYALAIMMLLIVPAGDPVRRIRFIAAVIAFLLTLGHVFVSSGVTRAMRKEKHVASLIGMAHWGGRFLKIGITLPFGAAAFVMLGPPEQTVWRDVLVCAPLVLIGLAFLFLQAALEGGRKYARYGR